MLFWDYASGQEEQLLIYTTNRAKMYLSTKQQH